MFYSIRDKYCISLLSDSNFISNKIVAYFACTQCNHNEEILFINKKYFLIVHKLLARGTGIGARHHASTRVIVEHRRPRAEIVISIHHSVENGAVDEPMLNSASLIRKILDKGKIYAEFYCLQFDAKGTAKRNPFLAFIDEQYEVAVGGGLLGDEVGGLEEVAGALEDEAGALEDVAGAFEDVAGALEDEAGAVEGEVRVVINLVG